MERKRVEKAILTTITSVASGAILGLLFAPEKGSVTRKKINDRGNELLKEVKKDISELREYLDKRAEETKSEISELGQEAKNKGEEVMQKAQKISSYDEWSKDELYEEAKKAEINGYSQMNKNELIEALKNN